jgi:hypothetical protein
VLSLRTRIDPSLSPFPSGTPVFSFTDQLTRDRSGVGHFSVIIHPLGGSLLGYRFYVLALPMPASLWLLPGPSATRVATASLSAGSGHILTIS